MADNDEQEAVMVRYLLGQSPAEEQAQVEERYFSDAAYFDQLLALEDSLIDDFVSGRMPVERLDAFKASLSVRQNDVSFTRALFQAVTQKKLDRPALQAERRLRRHSPLAGRRLFAWAVSIAALVLVVMSLALFLRNQTLKNTLSGIETQLARLSEEKEAAEQELGEARSQTDSSARELEIERNKRIDAENSLQKLRPESPDRSSDSKTIILGAAFILRGSAGTTREVQVSENIRWLRFVITLKGYDIYESYLISIKLVGQSEMFKKGSLKPTDSRSLAVTVPTANIPPGDYILALYGERPAVAPTELQAYSFRITGPK